MDKKRKEVNYSEMPIEELTRQEEKTREDLFKIQFRASLTPLKNVMEIRKLKREIARLNTFIQQRGKSG